MTTKLYGFRFTKVDATSSPLKGAEFTVTNGAGKYVNLNGSLSDTEVHLGDADISEFTFTGLKAGTYTVTETRVPSGFMSSIKAEFTVTIAKDGTVTYQEAAPGFGLITGDANAIKVVNVRSITELPHTGAAGTALFTVIAVLLAGAAVTLLAKSRAARRAIGV